MASIGSKELRAAMSLKQHNMKHEISILCKIPFRHTHKKPTRRSLHKWKCDIKIDNMLLKKIVNTTMCCLLHNHTLPMFSSAEMLYVLYKKPARNISLFFKIFCPKSKLHENAHTPWLECFMCDHQKKLCCQYVCKTLWWYGSCNQSYRNPFNKMFIFCRTLLKKAPWYLKSILQMSWVVRQ